MSLKIKIYTFLATFFFILFGVSQTSSFDLVSSPTSEQQGQNDQITWSRTFISVDPFNNYYYNLQYYFSGQLIHNGVYHLNNLSYFNDGRPIYKTTDDLGSFKLLYFTFYTPNPNNPSVPNSKLIYINKNDLTKFFELPTTQFFIKDNLLIIYDGTYLKYYTIKEDGSDYGSYVDGVFNSKIPLQTLSKPIGFVGPFSSFSYFDLPAYDDFTKGFVYKGLDGKGYFLSINGNLFKEIFVGGDGNFFGIFPFIGKNTLLFSSNLGFTIPVFNNYSQFSGSSIIDVGYGTVLDGSGNYVIYGSGLTLSKITNFINPYLYISSYSTATQYDMININQTIYKWNLHCKNPLYNSCLIDFSDGNSYCSNQDGIFDPEKILCSNSPISISSSDSSSDTSSDLSSGISTSSNDQQCSIISFTGSSAGLLQVNSTGGLLNDCSFRYINNTNIFGSQYKDIKVCSTSEGNICSQFENICLTNILPYDYYFKTDDETINKYNCINGDIQTCDNVVSCEWTDKNTCGPSNYCYVDGDYCKVKNEYLCYTSIDNNTDTTSSGGFWSSLIGTITNSINSLKNGITGGLNDIKDSIMGTGSTSTGIEQPTGNGFDSFSGTVLNTDGGEYSFTGGIGTGYNDIETDTNYGSGYCRMFNENGTFIYYSNGEGYTFDLNLSSLVPNEYLRDYVVVYVDKLVNIFLIPFNNTIGMFRSFASIDNNTDVCLFGFTKTIQYQGVFVNGSNKVNYSGQGDFNFVEGEMNFYDYFALFIFGLIVIGFLAGIIGVGSITSGSDTSEFNFHMSSFNEWGMPVNGGGSSGTGLGFGKNNRSSSSSSGPSYNEWGMKIK